MSARMVAQKGLDIVIGADLPSLNEGQFVFLGSGEQRYERVLAQFPAGGLHQQGSTLRRQARILVDVHSGLPGVRLRVW